MSPSSSSPTRAGGLSAVARWRCPMAPLPGSFTALTRLKFVNLSANHFIGPFPKGVADWVHLTLLEISNNDFDAPLPAEIEALPQQKGVDLSMESYKCKTATDKCRDYPGEVM